MGGGGGGGGLKIKPALPFAIARCERQIPAHSVRSIVSERNSLASTCDLYPFKSRGFSHLISVLRPNDVASAKFSNTDSISRMNRKGLQDILRIEW